MHIAVPGVDDPSMITVATTILLGAATVAPAATHHERIDPSVRHLCQQVPGDCRTGWVWSCQLPRDGHADAGRVGAGAAHGGPVAAGPANPGPATPGAGAVAGAQDSKAPARSAARRPALRALRPPQARHGLTGPVAHRRQAGRRGRTVAPQPGGETGAAGTGR